MEKITSPGTGTTALNQKASPLHLLIQALLFTSILHLTVGMTLPKTTVAVSKSPQVSASLLKSVTNAVLHDVSQSSGLATSEFQIIQAQQYTWSDDCLGVKNNFGILCTEMPVHGWRVAVVSGQQRWIYHTNASGSVVKLAHNDQ